MSLTRRTLSRPLALLAVAAVVISTSAFTAPARAGSVVDTDGSFAGTGVETVCNAKFDCLLVTMRYSAVLTAPDRVQAVVECDATAIGLVSSTGITRCYVTSSAGGTVYGAFYPIHMPGNFAADAGTGGLKIGALKGCITGVAQPIRETNRLEVGRCWAGVL